MGFEGVGDFFDELGEEEHLADEGQLVGVFQKGKLGFVPVQVLVFGPLEDAADPGVGVLDVVDGVFPRTPW